MSRPVPQLDGAWRTLLGRWADGSFVLDRELRLTWLDEGMARLLHANAVDLVARPLPELAEDPDHCRRALDEGNDRRIAIAMRALDGALVTVELAVQREGDVFVGVARDLTEQLAVEQRLSRSERSFRALIERIPDAIAVHREGRFVYANTALATMLGWDSAQAFVGTPLIDIVHPEDRDQTRSRLRVLVTEGATVPFAEARLLRKDGGAVPAWVAAVTVMFDGRPCVLAIGRDMREQRQLHTQLALSDRLTSLGTLAAGVAHEINNPLTYVMLGLDMISVRARRIRAANGTDGSATITTSLDEIETAVGRTVEGSQRVARIVGDLWRFARVDDDPPHPIDIRRALDLATGMATHELRRVGRFEIESDPNLPRVLGNEGRLAQVLLNLVINAVQSFAEPARSWIRVELRATATQVRVSVRDNGSGILPEHIPHLFDPFFTTKPIGTGTGLGLSVCHGIVTSLGGTIDVDSRPGTGSAFTIALPIAPDASS